MADEWLAGIGGGLDALAQVLQRRKLEKLQAAAVAEKIRQFNVEEARHEREAQAREAESTRYHDLLQQQRQDVLSTAAGVRRDQMAQDLLTKAPIAPGQNIGEGPAGNLRTRGYGSLLRTTLPPVGSRGEPAPMAPGVLTSPEGAAGGLPGGLRPTTRQPAQVDFPEGNPPYQEARAKEAARLAEIEAKAAEARTTKEAAERPKPVFRTNRRTGAPEQTGEVPFNAIVREEPPTKDTTTADQTRLDRSYQFTSKSLETLRKPFADRQERLGRLALTLRQGTPQADALIAPELLTAMAGGQGSGLRMNEAEIARIVGGRSAFENLRASLQHLSLDPAKANSLTPAQRQQVWGLVNAMTDRTSQASAAIDEGEEVLLDATDVIGHRRALARVRKRLEDIDKAIREPEAAAPHIPTYNRATRKFE